MNSLKYNLEQRKKQGHESVMHYLGEQKQKIEENMHVMKVMAIRETLYKLIDDENVKELKAKYIDLFFEIDDDTNNLTFYLKFKDHDHQEILFDTNGNKEAYKKSLYLVFVDLEENKLAPVFFDPAHAKEMEISKKGIEQFTKTLLNAQLRESFEASMQAMVLEEAISKPSVSKKNYIHKV